MSAGCRVVVLFFWCYLRHDRLWRLGVAERMATVRTGGGIDWHSNVRALYSILVRYSKQKNSSTHGRKGAKSTRVKRQSDLSAGSTQEAREKKKWVEPVTALLMALTTVGTAGVRINRRLGRAKAID
jgi:hypothetical protein